MSLLPKSANQFAEKTYWDSFFKKRGSKAFEWYGDYAQLCGLLLKYVKKHDNLLTVGCGNSTLSVEMYDVGYVNNVNIDVSSTVIKHMTDKYSGERPGLGFAVMDAKAMEFEDGSFSVVIDKGTVDALLPEDSEDCRQNVFKIFSEIRRVLRHGGRFICISLLQEHVLNNVLSFFTETAWMLRIHRCSSAEKPDASSAHFSFPVFIIVCTKMGEIPGFKPILEFAAEEKLPAQRMATKEEIVSSVLAIQQYALFCFRLDAQTLTEEATIDLHSPDSEIPRYKAFVVENAKLSDCPLQYGVFIVPQGRETDWLFSTTEGRQQLCRTAKTKRLLVVHLSSFHRYKDLEEVKEEISERARDYAPATLKKNFQIPIMSMGESIGRRSVIHSGRSESTGKYTVEDIENNGRIFRRLIFLSNPNIVQSEARMIETRNKKKGGKTSLKVDSGFLACEHHAFMIGGLAFLPPKQLSEDVDVLLIGLGGGGLPLYIQVNLPNIHVDVVDIDPDVVDIATKWFGLKSSSKLAIHVADGIGFVEESKEKYQVVMLDVNNNDPTSGMSVPPPVFLETTFLLKLRDILKPFGLVILNLVCRSENLKQEVYRTLSSVFGTFWVKSIPEEVNEVIFLPLEAYTEKPDYFADNIKMVNDVVKKKVPADNLIDVSELINMSCKKS